MALCVVNWNVRWATPRSKRSPEILKRIREQCPDIICLTETDSRLLSPLGGHVISSGPDWGQSSVNHRRKVLLWSSEEWTDVDNLGDDALPPGRFVAGTTETSAGAMTIFGVCIPYHNANVNAGAKTSGPWQEHARYLGGLAAMLERVLPTRLIVMGDFNQQIGQRRNPYPPHSQPVRAALRVTIQGDRAPGLTIVTAGLGLRGRRTIDHIAISGDLSAGSLGTIDSIGNAGDNLSDHLGVVANLSSV